jgi:RNA polymerase sigma-B factor
MLAVLPEREQKIVYLRFFEGLTQSEIADEIGISQMHVSRLLVRSLETLGQHASLVAEL